MKRASWFEAYEECRRRDSTLISFNIAAKWNEVMQLLDNQTASLCNNFWTSGSSNGHPGNFNWFGTGTEIKITTWLPYGNINATNESNCVEVIIENENKGLRAVPCLQPKGYICEVKRPKGFVIIAW